jgi:galactokinase
MEKLEEKKVREAFENEYEGPYRLFAAPGRINLIGEHTDYNEGFVLPASIDRRIYLAIGPRSDTKVELLAVDLGERAAFDLSQEQAEIPHWARYPFGVVKEFQKKGMYPGGFNAAFGGDIPTGAGLSSSAAIECAFAVALNTIFELGADKMTLARVGQSAEHNYAGVRCGIMDQFASLFGMKHHVMQLDCRSMDHSYFPLYLAGYELVLTDTQVKHSLASSAYNERRRQCETGVEVVRQKFPGIKSLRDINAEILQSFRQTMDKTVFRRCSYVIEENERVMQTCKALANGDLELVGQLLYLSHQGLRDQYEVSCAELDLLVETAGKIKGVQGSRMMGGGFGGCTISLVKSGEIMQFRQAMAKAFEKAFGRQPVFYEVNTGEGAGEITTVFP